MWAVAGTVSSLSPIALAASKSDPTAAFYSPPRRAWELAAGAMMRLDHGAGTKLDTKFRASARLLGWSPSCLQIPFSPQAAINPGGGGLQHYR